ncbi:MAG: TonB-dependent receptor, partial [Proteiniphilum sp.]
MKSITNKLFLSLFLLCSSVAVLDAQTVADTLLLPELVITERYSDREIRSTAPMQILSRKTISGLHAMQLSDAVKHFSGVTVKDYGGIGGLKTVSVRSLGAHHTA